MNLNPIFESSERFIQIRYKQFQRYFSNTQFESKPVTILVGQRGVGKTTLLVQYLVDKRKTISPEKTLYIQADHSSLKNDSIYEIAESFYADGGKVLCLDEIHKYPEWSKHLKSIIDTFPKLNLVVSGSSLLELTKGSHDLSRRVVIRKLHGLSFREFLNLKYQLDLPLITWTELIDNHIKIAKQIIEELNNFNIFELFMVYLQKGYYPYSFEIENDSAFFITLEQGLHATIESDILALHPELSGLSIHKLIKLFQVIASNVPYEPDLKDLKTHLQIGDDRTLKTYLNILHKAGILTNLYSGNRSIKVLEKPTKIYLNNTNLLWAVGGSTQLIDKGTLRETFFLSATTPKHTVQYSKQGDFLVDGKYTIEVGGKNKSARQIAGVPKSFIAMDGIEIGFKNNIPLWLFGFIY